MEQRSCNAENKHPEDTCFAVQSAPLVRGKEPLSLLPRGCKYRIRNTEMVVRLQVLEILQLFGMEGLLEQAMDIVLKHRFMSRHALKAKICLVSLYLARSNGVPLLIGDVRKVCPRDRRFFLKACSSEFGYQRVCSKYRNNVLHRFFSYIKPLGTRLQLCEARHCLDTLVKLHATTPLEILSAAAVMDLNIPQGIQAVQCLQEHFSQSVLKTFVEKIAGKKIRQQRGSNLCRGITLCSVFKRIRQCTSIYRKK